MNKNKVCLSYLAKDNDKQDLLTKSGLSVYFHDIHKVIWGFKLDDLDLAPESRSIF